MMGRKERAFGPLPPVTLEELVPHDFVPGRKRADAVKANLA
jgi:hypothetical protein